MAIVSNIPTRCRLEELLVWQKGLSIVPEASDLVLAGSLVFNAQIAGKARISDCYEVKIRISQGFPRRIPVVFETGGRIRISYNHLQDGSLCLGSETRLRLMLAEGLSLVGFVERCVIPYLYRYSYLKMYGEAPFDDLEHGPNGIAEDLRLLLGLNRQSEVSPFVRRLAMRGRPANKERCPCGSGTRVGRCHNRLINRLRERLGRYWFRMVEQQVANSVPSGKGSGACGRLAEWAASRASPGRPRSIPTWDHFMPSLSLRPAPANR